VTPPKVPLDGRSLTAILHNTHAPAFDRALHWQIGEGAAAEWAVREGDWKLMVNTRDTSNGDQSLPRIALFLANLKDDPAEKTNCADTFPQKVSNLRHLHEAQLSDL
jgi:hypothetical protein